MSAFGKILGLAGLGAAPFLPAAWAIPAALGGLGATKDEFIDAPKKRKSNEVLAGAMRYSPWLGAQQLHNISQRETPDEGVDGFMKGAVQGAALSAGMGATGLLPKGAGALIDTSGWGLAPFSQPVQIGGQAVEHGLQSTLPAMNLELPASRFQAFSPWDHLYA